MNTSLLKKHNIMKTLLTYIFILINLLSYAQKNMNFTLKELKTKKKSELVEIIFSMSKKKNPAFLFLIF